MFNIAGILDRVNIRQISNLSIALFAENSDWIRTHL